MAHTPSIVHIQATDVALYLRQRGWAKLDRTPHYTLWGLNDNEVLVPFAVENVDFGRLLKQALEKVAQVDNRSFAAVVNDLRELSADVVRVGISDATGKDSVPLAVADALFSSSHELVLAAACAAIAPRANYAHRKPSEALDFVRRTEIGQTERGSFVARVICPMPRAIVARQQSMFEEEVLSPVMPFERAVTRCLARGLEAAWALGRDALDDGAFGDLSAAVEKGVSANLCAALAALGDTDEFVKSVQVTVRWAAARPEPSLQNWQRTFPRDVLAALAEVAKELSTRATVEDVHFRGMVAQLKREAQGDSGEVTIYGFVDGCPRKVRAVLEPFDYDKAIVAHRDGAEVQCFGTLQRDGRRWSMKVESFAVLGAEA